jgi:hypothetical protein
VMVAFFADGVKAGDEFFFAERFFAGAAFHKQISKPS